jgi:hypothetical protein
MGDEFTLLDPETGLCHAFPRAISLKNEAIPVMERLIDDPARFGPVMAGTPKGTIRHVMPHRDAIRTMAMPATPGMILFPRFGHATAIRPVGEAELFMRLTQSSTNYVTLGERGYHALTRLVQTVPVRAIDYPDTDSAIATVEQLWQELV